MALTMTCLVPSSQLSVVESLLLPAGPRLSPVQSQRLSKTTCSLSFHRNSMTFDLLMPPRTLPALSWRQCLLLIVATTTASWLPSTTGFAPTSIFGYRRPAPSLAVSSSIARPRMQTPLASTNIDPLAVREYTEEAIQYRGQPRGLAALEKLGEQSVNRTPYDFDNHKSQKGGTVLAPQKGLIPASVTVEFLSQVRMMEQNGWLSTNPDSVDGLPSLHLNLVSGGKPIADGDNESLDDFQRGLEKLLSTVEPYIYDKLLPNVQKLTNDPSIRVSDVFLRRYGQDIGEEGTSRNGISAHYDVFSKVTSVIAMDDTAAEGTNGLFTTDISVDGSTSNHASLRRFFPLERGDGVVHTWDVLHGVDVVPNSDRTSLIVWFTTEEVLNSQTPMTSPWLAEHPDIETDDVAQFVLASALVSTDSDATDNSPKDAAMHHKDSRHSPTTDNSSQHPHDLYLQSAASGNTFALTRLGNLAQEQELSVARAKRGLEILETLRPNQEALFNEEIVDSDGSISLGALGRRFWLEGAVRGNPMAQAYLADDIMEVAVKTGNSDLRMLAAVLFGLAAQQGNGAASESLARVVEFEVAQNSIQSQEEFQSSPVVRTANAALQ